MGGGSGLFLCTSGVILLIGGYRWVRYVRGGRKPTEIPLIVISVALGLAFILLAPVVQAVESAFIPSLGRLLSNVCTLTAAFGFLHLMLYVSHPPEQVGRRVRGRLITLLLAVVVMTAMFFASDPPAGTGVFTGLYREQPTLVVYALVYSFYLGATVVELTVLAARSIRYTRTWLRLGMILLAIGCALAIGYLAEKVLSIVAELVTGSVAEDHCPAAFAGVHCTFDVGMPALSVLAIVLGAALPTLGPRVERLSRAVGHARSYRRLNPLWQPLHAALPNIEFAQADDPSGLPQGEIGDRLYRRVVAVRDGLLALQPYRDPADTREHRALVEAAGVPARRRAAAVEAADIATALRRRHHDEQPTNSTGSAERHDDLTSEIRWLVRVSREMARSEGGTTATGNGGARTR